MTSKVQKPEAATTPADSLVQQQSGLVAQAFANMNRMMEMRDLVTKGTADLATAWVQAAVAAQKEIAAMSADAAAVRDPVALMTLPQRAFQTCLRHAMECSAQNLKTAQALSSETLGTALDPKKSEPGTA